MPEREFVWRTHVEHRHEAGTRLLQKLIAGNGFKAVAVVEVCTDHAFDFGTVALRNSPERCQQIKNGLVGQSVEDELAVTPCGDDPGASHLLQMLRRVGDRQSGPFCEQLNAALALSQLLHQLEPVRVRQALGNSRKLNEQGALRIAACHFSHSTVDYSIKRLNLSEFRALVKRIYKAMGQVALVQEPYIRLGVFGGVFLMLAIWELVGPRRQQAIHHRVRWPSNLGIAVLDALLVRVVFPTTAVGLALVADASGWGLFHLIALPTWIAIVISIILLDLAIYLQHVLFHAVPALWRLHRMHHADLAFDVTTGFRFHPIEILLSMLIKLATIAALGPPAIAVLVFEVLLNATSMFNHANVLIPPTFDHVLRRVVVTPDMHRVHHSIRSSETNSNFGFNLPWWDRLFGTYRPQPSAGQSGMTIGIEQFRDARELRLDRMLIQPFHNEVGDYPFGHRQNER